MFVEFYRKRRAGLPESFIYLEPRGVSLELFLKVPVDVPDTMGYKILAEFGDIVRQVEPPSPQVETKKKVKRNTRQVK